MYRMVRGVGGLNSKYGSLLANNVASLVLNNLRQKNYMLAITSLVKTHTTYGSISFVKNFALLRCDVIIHLF